MYGIDPPTLVIVVSFLTLLLAVVMTAMRASFPRSIRGIGLWILAIPMFVGSTALFAQQNSHPFVHVMLANTLILGGVLCMTAGMLRFFGRPLPRARPVGTGVLLLLGALAWYTFIQPSFNMRLVLMSLSLTVLFAYLCLLPLRYGEWRVGAIVTSLAFLLTTCSCMLRMGTVLAGLDRPTGLLDFGTLQVVYLATFNLSVLVGSLGFILMANERLRAILEFNASHDALTGALNRGAFFRAAAREFDQSRETMQPLSILLLDLDHFKLINDRHGHAVGDRILQDFCNALRSVLRASDALGRYGGEEFVVLLPGVNRDEALAVAHRLREAIQPPLHLPTYTVSMGVTTLTAAIEDIDELLYAADKALYLAKRNGRNRIEEWLWADQTQSDPFQHATGTLEPAAEKR